MKRGEKRMHGEGRRSEMMRKKREKRGRKGKRNKDKGREEKLGRGRRGDGVGKRKRGREEG